MRLILLVALLYCIFASASLPKDSDLQALKFQIAAEKVRQLTRQPTNDELLNLYSLYKKVTVGDVNVKPPGFFSSPRERAKYNAWLGTKDKSKEDCEKEYIALVEELAKKYGLKPGANV